MTSLEAQLPDPTKILFILDILKNNGKRNLSIDISEIYNFIRDIGRNGIRFNYVKYYEFKEGDKLFNSILNRDLMNLKENNVIEFINGDELEFTPLGRKIVEYFKNRYESPYEHIENLICASPIFE